MRNVSVTIVEAIKALKTFQRSPFLRNMLVLMSGTALAQIITVSIAPVLTRLYDPADFGLFGIYGAVVGLVTVIVTLQYDQALMLPKEVVDAANLLGASVLSVTGIAGLSALVCFTLGDRIAGLMKSPELARWLWLVPGSIFLSGLYQSFNSWSTRQKKFRIRQSDGCRHQQIRPRGTY
jgi:lipopolysaccharide exporter